MPYRFQDEISTADVAFEAWGATREELFISSAAALLGTMTAAPEQVSRRQQITVRLEHAELDLLLWTFLQELIFFKDARRLLLHADRVRIEERDGIFRLQAHVSGERIDVGRHRLLVDVKAVTLHRLRVAFQDNRWRAVVVLDV
jgi:SHS2 domain-containing protein